MACTAHPASTWISTQDQTIGWAIRNPTAGAWRRFACGIDGGTLRALIDDMDAAGRIQDPARRAAALAEAEKKHAAGAAVRVYVGKTYERAARVSLSDANGKPRLNLTVDATGNPRIEFLDESGKVTARVPAR